MKPSIAFLAVCLAALPLQRADAQNARPTSRSPLTLERLTSGSAFTGTSPGAVTWTADSRELLFLWNPPGAAGRTLWRVGRNDSVASRVLAAGNTASVGTFLVSPDDASIVFLQNGALWRVPRTGGVPAAVTRDAGGFSQMQFSPDGSHIAFLRDGDLWLLAMSSGQATRVTNVSVPAIGSVPLGTYFRRDAEIGSATWGGGAPTLAWSPDSRTIAVHYVDRRAVPSFAMPYYLGDTVLLNRVRRGAPGETNEVRKVGLVDVGSRALRFVELPDSSSTRVVTFAWSSRGELLIDRESDDAIVRTLTLVAPGAATEALRPRTLWQDARDTRIYNDVTSVWSADGRSVLLTSDLDDRYRVYRVTPGDSVPVALTTASADVAGAAIPRAGTGSIDYLSTAPRPSERHLFRLPAAGGSARQLTTMAGAHQPTVSPDGRTVALVSSSDTSPNELYLLDTRAGARERRVTRSRPAVFAEVPWVSGTYVQFPSETDNAMLHARILLPPNLDTTRQYPVLFGPAYSNTARNRWGGQYGMLQQFLAIEREYIIVQVDVRGSTGYGREFREQFLMDWGGRDLEDIESAVNYMKSLPYADPNRFGIWGSSYGGTLTVYALLTKPGLFQAGVAGAAATDPFFFGSDDVAIVRRPQSHPATFERGALQYAGNLRDHLLLIHGMQDDVVPISTSIKLAEEFMRLGKDFDFAFAPAATHGWTQRPYYARHLLGKLVQHFDRYLGPGGRAR